MPKYRRIYARFWIDERIRALEPTEKLLALYCLTSTQTNRIGLFAFSAAMAEEDTGLHDVAHAVNILLEKLEWSFDTKSRVLFIPTWWRFNTPQNASVLKGALKDIEELPKTQLLQEFIKNVDDIPQSMRWCISHHVAHHPSLYQYQYQYQYQDNSNVDLGKNRVQGSTGLSKEQIDSIYRAYPRHVAPRRAKTAIRKAAERYAKAEPDLDTFAAIMERVEIYAASPAGRKPAKNEQDFRPHPASWFNGDGFLSDPAEWSREVSEDGYEGPKALFSLEALQEAKERGLHDDVAEIEQGLAEIAKENTTKGEQE